MFITGLLELDKRLHHKRINLSKDKAFRMFVIQIISITLKRITEIQREQCELCSKNDRRIEIKTPVIVTEVALWVSSQLLKGKEDPEILASVQTALYDRNGKETFLTAVKYVLPMPHLSVTLNTRVNLGPRPWGTSKSKVRVTNLTKLENRVNYKDAMRLTSQKMNVSERHFPRARVPQLPMQVRVHGLPPGTLPPGVRQLRLSLEVRINGLPPGPPCRTLPPGVREPQQPLRGGVYGIPPRPPCMTLPSGVRERQQTLRGGEYGVPPGPPCMTLPPGVRERQRPLRGEVYGVPPRPPCMTLPPGVRERQQPLRGEVYGVPPGPPCMTLPPGVRERQRPLRGEVYGVPPGPPCMTLPPGVRERQQPLRGEVYGVPPGPPCRPLPPGARERQQPLSGGVYGVPPGPPCRSLPPVGRERQLPLEGGVHDVPPGPPCRPLPPVARERQQPLSGGVYGVPPRPPCRSLPPVARERQQPLSGGVYGVPPGSPSPYVSFIRYKLIEVAKLYVHNDPMRYLIWAGTACRNWPSDICPPHQSLSILREELSRQLILEKYPFAGTNIICQLITENIHLHSYISLYEVVPFCQLLITEVKIPQSQISLLANNHKPAAPQTLLNWSPRFNGHGLLGFPLTIGSMFPYSVPLAGMVFYLSRSLRSFLPLTICCCRMPTSAARRPQFNGRAYRIPLILIRVPSLEHRLYWTFCQTYFLFLLRNLVSGMTSHVFHTQSYW
ncbi:hypothetical protein J6590_019579 [Homalodisca vitripennis]|nr:hypothetical protein J6590_019579 [Homalodisca vitripennis]